MQVANWKYVLAVAPATLSTLQPFDSTESGYGIVDADRDVAAVHGWTWSDSTGNSFVPAGRAERVAAARLPKAVLISRLVTLDLTRPITVVVENDEQDFLARSPDLPQLYGYGKTESDALAFLVEEIESLWDDLSEDDDFAPSWAPVREYLKDRIEA